MPIINAQSLYKNFGKFCAVNGVSLQIDQGIIFGLLGPNGAGKTTIIRLLCGLLKADTGKIWINNQPISRAKQVIGYVAQNFGLYEELTVWENLKFYAELYQVSETSHLHQLLERYELTPFIDQPANTLSGGYKRRLSIACALAHNPSVLFLDEPTAGIDPITRKQLWDHLYQLSHEGVTIFVTTHYMEEAQRCHQLAFINHGSLVALGTPEKVKSSLGSAKVYKTEIPYQPELVKKLNDLEGLCLVNQFGNQLRLVLQNNKHETDHLLAIIKATIASNLNINTSEIKLHRVELSLEDVFIVLTQNVKQTESAE